MSEPGHNGADAELKRRIERRVAKLDEVAELAAEIKTMKDEDKADGYNEKAIADAVKLLRADPDKVLATLMFEAERDVYRRAAGVPVEIEAAQRAAQAAADTVPAPKKKRGDR